MLIYEVASELILILQVQKIKRSEFLKVSELESDQAM